VLAASTRALADLTADEARVLSGRKDMQGRDFGKSFLKLNEQLLKELSKPEDAQARKQHLLPAAERNLRLQLSNLQELLVVDATFRRISSLPNAQVFEATFGYIPR
jgi:hypothetical protein